MVAVTRPLHRIGARFAVIGGMAVSYRTIERFTKDVDLAIAVEDDAQAEQVVNAIKGSGYFADTIMEQEAADRLSTVRMVPHGDREMFVDLLFASSGIESEVVASATNVEITPGLTAPVANIPSLISLKVLSGDWKRRPQDIVDLQYLIKSASPSDLTEARHLLDLITTRGYNRNKDLQKDLDGYIEQFTS